MPITSPVEHSRPSRPCPRFFGAMSMSHLMGRDCYAAFTAADQVTQMQDRTKSIRSDPSKGRPIVWDYPTNQVPLMVGIGFHGRAFDFEPSITRPAEEIVPCLQSIAATHAFVAAAAADRPCLGPNPGGALSDHYSVNSVGGAVTAVCCGSMDFTGGQNICSHGGVNAEGLYTRMIAFSSANNYRSYWAANNEVLSSGIEVNRDGVDSWGTWVCRHISDSNPATADYCQHVDGTPVDSDVAGDDTSGINEMGYAIFGAQSTSNSIDMSSPATSFFTYGRAFTNAEVNRYAFDPHAALWQDGVQKSRRMALAGASGDPSAGGGLGIPVAMHHYKQLMGAN